MEKEAIQLTRNELDTFAKSTVSELLKQLDPKIMETVKGSMGNLVATELKSQVDRLRLDRALFGQDVIGLDKDTRLNFVKEMFAIASGARLKAPKAFTAARMKDGVPMLEDEDFVGGYLVAPEVADAILRVAASVGIVLKQAQKWPTPKGNELDIPNYQASFLTGNYLGINQAGPIQGMPLSKAVLLIKKWQIAFALDNALIEDASVELADWLMVFVAEALANMIDLQGFVGSGNPFVGILNHPNVGTYYLGNSSTSGKTKLGDFNIVEDAANAMAQLEESVLEDCAFYMHRTVWAQIRTMKDSSGAYILPWAGAGRVVTVEPMGRAPSPFGEMCGFPVYSLRHLPQLPAANAASPSTKFMVFGNLKRGLGFADKGEMELTQYKSGAFGGKEIALADQTGMVVKQRHGIVVQLPNALLNISTAAS